MPHSVLITESSELWAIQQSGTGYGLAQGPDTRTGTRVSGTVLPDPVGFAVSCAVASSVSCNTLTGTLSSGYLSATFSGTWSAYHLSTPLLTRVAGIHVPHSGSKLTVSASATIAGIDEGRSFTGTENATGARVVVPVSDNLACVGEPTGGVGACVEEVRPQYRVAREHIQ